jgi:hypothetical protein
MIGWPLAIICVVGMVCVTIIVCAGRLWTDEWLRWRDQP